MSRSSKTDQQYTGVVSDKLGPFSLPVPVRIEVLAVDAPRHISVALAGDDQKGQARIRGTLQALAAPLNEGSTRLTLRMRIDVLGKLASLGHHPCAAARTSSSPRSWPIRVVLGPAVPAAIG